MKKKLMLLIVGLLVSSVALWASESPAAGLLKGRVYDNERNPLQGATVMIDGHRQSAVTDADGFYSFANLTQGSHRLKVSYIGFVPVEKVVELSSANATVDIVMSETSNKLGEVVVTGVFSGQRKAINAQKNNLNVTNVVSADQIGKFPDSNIGDALKRISGINVQYDQGEARFGQVRGTPADFSSVTVNGSRIPSAEGDVRSVQLDLIPSDMIQAIEVSKTLLPDQDGDAIGGLINLVTKHTPHRLSLGAVAGTGYNWVSRKAQMNFGLTAGNRFFGDRLGVMFSASYNNAPSGSYDTEFLWEKDGDGKVYVSDYQMRRYYVTRERQSYSLSADWKFGDSGKIWFKGFFNNRNDWENRYRTTLKDISPEGTADVRIQTKGGPGDNRDARLERQRAMDFTLGGENRFKWLEMDWKMGYARASEQRPNERYIDYRLKSQSFTPDISNPRQPFFLPAGGSTMVLDENFSLKELTQQQEDIAEQDLKASLDFKARIGDSSKLKFGAKFVSKSKDKEVDFYEYAPTDKKAFDAGAFAHVTDQNTGRFMPSAKYQAGTFVSKEFLSSLDLEDGKQFEGTQVTEELAGNYSARENVTSGYVRIDSHLGDRLKFMGGLRVENTALRYTGRVYDEESGTVTETSPASSDYVNFLPSLIVKWEICKDFFLRGGYNQSLSRPKYSALVPGMSIKRGDNEIKIGNPGLKAISSHNLDLNAEYYWKSVGLLSFGAFYKKIDGFIVDEVAYNKEYDGHVWTKLTQPKNGGNAHILGAEIVWQRDLGFISPALRCLGLYATYTYTHSRVTDFNIAGRENEKGLSLPGSPKHTANVSLYFEKNGLSARLSLNYASAFIDEMGASAFYDRYYDAVKYMDFNVGYTFGKKTRMTVYADCTNLLNQPLRYYQGSRNFTMQQEFYGPKFNGGIKMTF